MTDHVFTNLLLGSAGPNDQVFFQATTQVLNRPTGQFSLSWWFEASGSSRAGSSSSSVVLKFGDDQSIPNKAWNSASSSTSSDGSISGAKVCLQIGGIRSIIL